MRSAIYTEKNFGERIFEKNVKKNQKSDNTVRSEKFAKNDPPKKGTRDTTHPPWGCVKGRLLRTFP